MKNLLGILIGVITAVAGAVPEARADVTSATIQALRMAGMITGGSMPASAPEFATMVTNIQAGNYAAAAQAAINSAYFPAYLPRRMARQMMNTHLSEVGVNDNDATLFIVANLIGSSTTASIAALWSQNSTYLVNVGGVATHVGALSAAQLAAVNWRTDIVKNAGQSALVLNGTASDGTQLYATTTIPVADVGGYMTLNNSKVDGGGGFDNSFAQNGFYAGTNLRAVEGMYITTLGLSLPQMVGSTTATSNDAPRFIPQLNPSFSVGQGQPACLSCHGTGASNLSHGYQAFADKFDFDPDHGLIYFPTPSTSTRKSLGSDPGLRNTVLNCNLNNSPAPNCNTGAASKTSSQSWDLASWMQSGLLTQWGWTGATSGSGLNALGTALGKADLVYEFLTKRVIQEICPLGTFTPTQIDSIAASAKVQDSFATIVSAVATDLSCL